MKERKNHIEIKGEEIHIKTFLGGYLGNKKWILKDLKDLKKLLNSIPEI